MTAWPSTAEAGPLDNAEAHLWLVPLDQVAELLPDPVLILSEDERLKAQRFHQRVDGQRYAVARASLRCLLGNYLNVAPSRLRFGYDPHGKPRLAGPEGTARVQFNVSHSAAFGLLGFVLDRKIGVDLERIRRDVEIADLAARFFSRGETEALASLAGDAQIEAFYRCWTRKEAYLKALGHGLSHGLDHVEVTLKRDEPAAIIRVADDPEASRRWKVTHLTPMPGYLGASVVETPDLPDLALKCFTWSPRAETRSS